MNNRAELLFTLVCKRAERVPVEQFALQHDVTSRTVYKDVERLSALLQAKGYPRIDNIRGTLQQNWPYISLIADKDISPQCIAKIRKYIDVVAGLLSVEFSEEAQKRLIAYLMVSAIRFNAGKRIDISSKKLNVGRESVSREYRAVCDCSDMLEILYN